MELSALAKFYLCSTLSLIKFSEMDKRLKQEILQKDTTINKRQFDKIWYYSLADMKSYMGEDLSEVEYITLPFMIDGEEVPTKCSTLEDIERGRKKEPRTGFDKRY